MRSGLFQDVRLWIYLQLIRNFVAYAFPLWFDILSHQMKRHRLWEQKIVSFCLDLRPIRRSDGSYGFHSCRSIYDKEQTHRIDKCRFIDNIIVEGMLTSYKLCAVKR